MSPSQPRRGDGRELRRGRASRGVVVGRQLEPHAVAAQVIVHLEPERHGGFTARGPRRARMAIEQEQELRGPAVARVVVRAQADPALGPKRSHAIRPKITTTNARLKKTAAEPKSLA